MQRGKLLAHCAPIAFEGSQRSAAASVPLWAQRGVARRAGAASTSCDCTPSTTEAPREHGGGPSTRCTLAVELPTRRALTAAMVLLPTAGVQQCHASLLGDRNMHATKEARATAGAHRQERRLQRYRSRKCRTQRGLCRSDTCRWPRIPGRRWWTIRCNRCRGEASPSQTRQRHRGRPQGCTSSSQQLQTVGGASEVRKRASARRCGRSALRPGALVPRAEAVVANR
jgi:hypothetical protein